MVNASPENQDHGGAHDSNFEDHFNLDDFDERNEYDNENGIGTMTDGFIASSFESNNAGSTTPSALGGDFTLVSTAGERKAEDNNEPSGGPSSEDVRAQEDGSTSVDSSPKDGKEPKPETSLLDQNSPLSELSPLPSHNNSIDMEQEPENDDTEVKTKAKSRDTSPLSPASSRQQPSSPGPSTSKAQLSTSTGSKLAHSNAVAGPSSATVVPPPLSSSSSSSAPMSPTSKRAEVDRKIRTVLEINAELFTICMAFYSKGILKGLETEQFNRRLRENLTWLASQADSSGSEIKLPELSPPTMPVTSIELPSLEKLTSLYAQLPEIFARDIMRKERKSMMGPPSSLNSSVPNFPFATPQHTPALAQTSGLRNSTSSPDNNISMKRDRPDAENDVGSPSPAHKRRDTGEGKSTQSLMMPPPPPPSAASPVSTNDASQQQQQQLSNSGLSLSSGVQQPGLSSMGPGLFPSGSNAQQNGLGDLSTSGLFPPGPNSTSPNVQGAVSPGSLDNQARQMHMRMQMGRVAQQQQSQFLAQGMGNQALQQVHSQMQDPNTQAQQALMPQAARQQEISLGSSTQPTPPPVNGPGGMQQHQQGVAQPQSPIPGQANPSMALQMAGNIGATQVPQSTAVYIPPAVDPSTLQQIRQHGGAILQGFQILQTPNHPLVKRLVSQVPNVAQLPVLEQIKLLITSQQRYVQQMQNQGMWLQQQQLHAQHTNAHYDVSQQGNTGMQQNSPYGSLTGAGGPMRPSMQQQQTPQMQQISLGSQVPQQGNVDGMQFSGVGMARSVSGGSNPLGVMPAGGTQNSMHLGLPGSLSHLDPQQRRPLLVQQTQQFAQRGGIQQPGMQSGMMNQQMLAAQQPRADLQRFALAQAQAQAQRQTSPLNPNAGPGSPAIGSSSMGQELQASYPPGMPSNPLQAGVPGIARSSRSPSVSDTPRLSSGPSIMQGMGMGFPGQPGQGQMSNDEYQRQLAYLAAQKKMQQQAPQNSQSQVLGPTAWPQQQQASNFAYGQQAQPGAASSWSPMGFQQQQQQGYPHAASPTGGIRHSTPDQSGIARQSSSTPAPGSTSMMSMSMQQQSQSPAMPDSTGFDMVNWGAS